MPSSAVAEGEVGEGPCPGPAVAEGEGEVGEIVIRGYLPEPRRHAEMVRNWCCPRQLARCDGDDYYVVDRG